MKKKTAALMLISTLVLASIAVTGCTSSTTPSTQSATSAGRLVNYTSAKGFALQYPDTWKKTQPASGNITVMFDLPTNNSNENMNIQVRPTSGARQTLDDYTKQTLSEISKNKTNKLIEDRGNVTLGGNAAHEVIYNTTVSGKPLQVMQVWTFHGNSVYFITYKATPEHYDQYVDTANQMLDSFYFT